MARWITRRSASMQWSRPRLMGLKLIGKFAGRKVADEAHRLTDNSNILSSCRKFLKMINRSTEIQWNNFAFLAYSKCQRAAALLTIPGIHRPLLFLLLGRHGHDL